MVAYPHPRHVPGLEAVARTLESAERLQTEGPPFRLCICDEQGTIIAAATVEGFDKVKAFSRHMARLGFAALIAGDHRAGCDVRYVPTPGARDIFDDGGPSSAPAPLEG
jgi:hypothetical protein